jgi:hypothetical protein
MSKSAGLLMAFMLSLSMASAQNSGKVQKSSFGVQFIMNDFVTATNIRNNNIGTVMKNKEFGVINKMAPGIALTYMKGIDRNYDIATTLSGSFVDYPIPEKNSFGREFLLLEADASIRGKLIPNEAVVNPYLQAGFGGSMYKGYFAAFLPVGMGLQINLFNDSYLLINAQYRVPVTQLANYHLFYGIGFAGNIGKSK